MDITNQGSQYLEFKENSLTSFANDTGKDIFLRDTVVQGMGCRITPKGTKSFFVEVWVNGRTRRKNFARFPKITVKEARKEAKKLIGEFADDKDSVGDAKAVKAADKTLQELFADYLDDRPKLKQGTLDDYNRVMKKELESWKDRNITEITKDMVKRHHKELTKNSPSRADNAMRVLRALYNYAIAEYELADGTPLVTINPTIKITATRTWNRTERRTSYITNDQLEAWFKAVDELNELESTSKVDSIRDYFVFCLLTGFRAAEAACLKWDQVNFKSKTFRATDTKNSRDQLLPMTDYLEAMLQRRYETVDSPYVFDRANGDPLGRDQRKWCAKITETSGVEFIQHDLRRTFITIAESLDIPYYALKRLVNHKADKTDVTEGYIQLDAERLRKPMQLITDHILRFSHIKPSGEVVNLVEKRG